MTYYKTDEYRKKHAEYSRNYRAKHPHKAIAATKRWAKRNPEKYRLVLKNSGLKKHYGITLAQHDEILMSQGNRCAICRSDHCGRDGKTKGWCIDHCHTTNRVRGILCNSCNALLGYAKDDKKVLAAAIKYLSTGLLFPAQTRASWKKSGHEHDNHLTPLQPAP